jgi:transcription initiation factor TFIIE subunit alpha
VVVKITGKVVDEVVAEVAGPDVVPLVRILSDKSNVSEFKLADSMKAEINITRNMLYRLYDHNLVSFSRKKDKKKGWYIYYWTFNKNRVRDLLITLRKKKIEKLQERLQREKTTQFYVSKEAGIRLDFEKAHDFNFKCPETGQLMEVEDNSQRISELERDLAQCEMELKELLEEVIVKERRPVSKAEKKSVKKLSKKPATKKTVITKKKSAKKVVKKKKK